MKPSSSWSGLNKTRTNGLRRVYLANGRPAGVAHQEPQETVI